MGSIQNTSWIDHSNINNLFKLDFPAATFGTFLLFQSLPRRRSFSIDLCVHSAPDTGAYMVRQKPSLLLEIMEAKTGYLKAINWWLLLNSSPNYHRRWRLEIWHVKRPPDPTMVLHSPEVSTLQEWLLWPHPEASRISNYAPRSI